jgi:Zn-dependent peptidase ImmA (M78 family)
MFTVAHELGHWELHRHLFPASYGQRGLFSEKNAPTIVCRTSSRKDPMEWQADCFAGYLLMPQEMVLAAWKAARGALEPYVAVQEIADKLAKWGLVEDRQPTVDIARQLAAEFDVSGQAMQIRLIGLGLIQMSQRQPKLFSNQAKPQEQEVKPITT